MAEPTPDARRSDASGPASSRSAREQQTGPERRRRADAARAPVPSTVMVLVGLVATEAPGTQLVAARKTIIPAPTPRTRRRTPAGSPRRPALRRAAAPIGSVSPKTPSPSANAFAREPVAAYTAQATAMPSGTVVDRDRRRPAGCRRQRRVGRGEEEVAMPSGRLCSASTSADEQPERSSRSRVTAARQRPSCYAALGLVRVERRPAAGTGRSPAPGRCRAKNTGSPSRRPLVRRMRAATPMPSGSSSTRLTSSIAPAEKASADASEPVAPAPCGSASSDPRRTSPARPSSETRRHAAISGVAGVRRQARAQAPA